MVRRNAPALLLALVLALTGLVSGVAPASAAAPAGPRFSLSPAVAGERLDASGRMPTRIARPVALQRRDGSRWRTVATGRTKATGAYRLGLRAPSESATYRVQAKPVRVGGKRYPAVTTRTAALAVVAEQQVTVVEAPSTGAVGDTVDVRVRVSPGRVDQVVQLQRSTADGWVDVGDGVFTGSSGAVTLDLSLTAPGVQTYRARVDGAPAGEALTSETFSIAVSAPRMTRISSGSGNDGAVQMTDDGNQVLWLRNGTSPRVWRRDTGQSTPITLPFSNAFVADATPDLQHLLLTNGNNSRLAVWDRQTGDVDDVVNDPDVLFSTTQISDDGQVVVVEAGEDLTVPSTPGTANNNVFVWEATSPSTLRVVRANQPDNGLIGANRNPVISGDGRYVFYNAYASETDPDAEFIEGPQVVRWSRSDGGSTVLPNTGEAQLFNNDSVSTDGDDLVISEPGGGQIVWHTGGGVDQVPPPAGASSFGLTVDDLSPDGTRMVFNEASTIGADDVVRLYTWTVGSGSPTLVSSGPDGEVLDGSGGQLSSDGTFVAFSSGDNPVTGAIGVNVGQNLFLFDASAS